METKTLSTKAKNSIAALIATSMLATSGLAAAYGGIDAKPHKSFNKGFSKGHAPKTAEQRQQMQTKRLERMASMLGLSDTQKTQIQNVFAQNKNKHEDLRKQSKNLQQTLKQQRQDNASLASKEATHDELYQLQKQKRALRDQERAQIDNILTSEQRAKMDEMHANRMQRMHDFRRDQ